MRKESWLLTGMAAFFLAAAGCAPSRVEMDYGTSAKLAVLNQTLNPQAAKNLEPVVGFDGGAGKATMDRFQKDFEKPPAPPVYTLSIGSSFK